MPAKLVLILLVLFSFTTDVLAQKKREYYQLTVYHYTTETQEKQLDAYLQQALLPALHRLQIKQVGVFKAIANDTAAVKKLYVLIPAKKLNILTDLPHLPIPAADNVTLSHIPELPPSPEIALQSFCPPLEQSRWLQILAPLQALDMTAGR